MGDVTQNKKLEEKLEQQININSEYLEKDEKLWENHMYSDNIHMGKNAEADKLYNHFSKQITMTEEDYETLKRTAPPKPKFTPVTSKSYKSKLGCNKKKYRNKVKNYYKERDEYLKTPEGQEFTEFIRRKNAEYNAKLQEDQADKKAVQDEMKNNYVDSMEQVEVKQEEKEEEKVEEKKVKKQVVIDESLESGRLLKQREKRNDPNNAQLNRQIGHALAKESLDENGKLKTIPNSILKMKVINERFESFEAERKRIAKRKIDLAGKTDQASLNQLRRDEESIKEMAAKEEFLKKKLETLKKYNEDPDSYNVPEIQAGDECFQEKMKERSVKSIYKNLFPKEDDLGYNLTQRDNTCYMLSGLKGIINLGKSDYIKNVMIKEEGYRERDYDEVNTVRVRLFDAFGLPVDVIVDVTSKEMDNSRPLWIVCVEKAAAVLMSKQISMFKVGGDGAALTEYVDWENVTINDKVLTTDDVVDGSEEVGMSVLIGQTPLAITTRSNNEEDYDYDTYLNTDYVDQGDIAVGQMAEYIKQGKIVTASTCGTPHNLNTLEMLIPEGAPVSEELNKKYVSKTDTISFMPGFNVSANHAVTITDIDEEKGIIKIADSLNTSNKEITIEQFKHHFSDFKVSEPSLIKNDE